MDDTISPYEAKLMWTVRKPNVLYIIYNYYRKKQVNIMNLLHLLVEMHFHKDKKMQDSKEWVLLQKQA